MNQSEGVPRSPGEVPGRRITINQLVGYNMARWRKAAKMGQQELGARMGWTNVTVSAAEHSWDGKRIRHFDADEIVSLAFALGVPVGALLLPPDDDGASVVHYFETPGQDRLSSDMADLLEKLLPGLPARADVGAAWDEAFVAALSAHLDRERGEVLTAALGIRDATGPEALLEDVRSLRKALLAGVSMMDQIVASAERDDGR